MKNRDYKNLGIGSIVHIYNRGNNKEKIFYDEKDYEAFILRLSLALGYTQEETKNIINVPNSRIRISPSKKDDFKLHAFCLMPNHFHLLIEQCGDTTISSLLSKVSTSFSMYINKRHGRVGHVFQDQFKSVLVDSNEQLMWVSAYIHMNPVKDNIVKNPEEYKWSSYKEFTGKRDMIIISQDLLNSIFENNFVKETLSWSRAKGNF
ncbi:MAG: transposase [Minisyncoccota bacterium]